jgi:hypothetical protein
VDSLTSALVRRVLLAIGMTTYEQVTRRHRLARRDYPFFFAGVAVIIAALVTALA